jgi:hypothetical protein
MRAHDASHVAASSLSEDVVDTLLAFGCDPAAVDARGRSALVYAIVRSGFVGAPAERAVSIVHRLLRVEGAALLSPLCWRLVTAHTPS